MLAPHVEENEANLLYAMLAKEMSNTQNRGRILWVFATSRPDLLEVDLKRQGRLDDAKATLATSSGRMAPPAGRSASW